MKGIAFVFYFVDRGTELLTGFSHEIKVGERNLCTFTELHKFIAMVMEKKG